MTPGATAPTSDGTSRLSPHLRWGEIGPARSGAQSARRMEEGAIAQGTPCHSCRNWSGGNSPMSSCSTIRDLADTNYNEISGTCPGATASPTCKAWQKGQTGYPMVDAGMRQLWQTRLDAQSRAHDHGQLPDQASPAAMATRRRTGSGTRWSMPTRPPMRPAGNGWPGPAPMRRPISASSTRSRRARNSTRRATMSAAGARELAAFRQASACTLAGARQCPESAGI